MDPKQFEDEVAKIASQLWPSAQNGGAHIIDGQERDGIYITDEMVHLIECTMMKTKEKAEKDVGKLKKLTASMQKQYSHKGVKAWFITNDEPTADQRGVVTAASMGNSIVAISFERFQSKIIEVSSYINLRKDHFFGSVRNPGNDKDFKYENDIIKVDLVEDITNNLWSIDNIYNKLHMGKKIVILGHYGVGKSIALREIHKIFSLNFLKKRSIKFSIYINLREHHGQTDPVEVLERHARLIGFAYPAHLIRAWKSGYASIILDGFDEIAVFGWAKSKLRDIRYKSVQLIREFIRHTPKLFRK